jgi:hypothetical protein
MANITNEIRAWNSLILNVDADPSVAPGVVAGIGSLAIAPNGVIYNKSGVLDTSWGVLSTPSAVVSIPDRYVAYVNKSGNDGTALVNDIAKPFLTVQAAINAAVAAGYVNSANRCNIFISPGIYTENLTLASSVNLVSSSSQMDVTVRIEGEHVYAPVSGSIADNTVNLIGLYLSNGSASPLANPVLSLGGTVPCRVRLLDTSVDMSAAASTSNAVVVNNSNAVLYVSCNLTMAKIERRGAAADSVQVISGTFSSFGCDVAAGTGRAIDIAGGTCTFAYGTLSSSGSEVVRCTGVSTVLNVATAAITNSLANQNGINNNGSTVTLGQVLFNVTGTGYCATGTGPVVYAYLSFATANTKFKNTLTPLPLAVAPTSVP